MTGVEHHIDETYDLAIRPDATTFAELLRRHDAELRAFAWRIVSEDLDDVLQDAYLKAYRGWADFRGQCSVGTWLHRIVYTTAIDHLRRRDRRRALVDRLQRQPHDLVDVVDDQRLDVAAALAHLPVADRAVLLLVDAQQLTYADAALVLDVPAGTIASRLNRARRSLRRQLTTRSTR